jgi:hypothetical protein
MTESWIGLLPLTGAPRLKRFSPRAIGSEKIARAFLLENFEKILEGVFFCDVTSPPFLN